MNATTEDLRLFRPFLDPIDMVMCCAADTSLAKINELAGTHELRFPLVGDPSSSLQTHLAVIDYAPSSARFGPYVDNVLGMNWELASGRLVRIGERVIKSTTGYDLLRFLLHSGGRYGRARDYVLRLQPHGGNTARGAFHGEYQTVDQVRALLLHSPWIHWLDAVNLYVSPTDGSVLEVEADCGNGEPAIFAEYFAKIGRETGAAVSTQTETRCSGLPILSLKTTVVTAPQVACRLVRDHGGSARVLCVNGVVHYFPSPDQHPLSLATVEELSAQCAREGGHIMGSWAGDARSCEQEAIWANELKAAWNQL